MQREAVVSRKVEVAELGERLTAEPIENQLALHPLPGL